MKQILSIFSTLTLTSSAILILTNTVDNHVQQTKTETRIDWNYIKNSNSNYFKNLKQDNKQVKLFYSRENSIININQIMDSAEQKSNEYIARFANQNLKFNEIINILLNENRDFKENYQNALQQSKQINNKINDASVLKVFSTTPNYEFIKNWLQSAIALSELDQHIKNLKTIGITFTTMATAAAIAAAAFFAIAFFTFGISTVWGSACSVAAAILGSIAAGLDLAVLKYDQKRESLALRISTGMITLNDVFTLGHLSYTIVSAFLPAAASALSATTWAFPAGVALFSVITGILSWISFYK